jgi:hypothetical protein
VGRVVEGVFLGEAFWFLGGGVPGMFLGGGRGVPGWWEGGVLVESRGGLEGDIPE